MACNRADAAAGDEPGRAGPRPAWKTASMSRHMERTPHRRYDSSAGPASGASAAECVVRALESWRRKGEDRHRRMPRLLLHGPIGRMGQGGDERGSGAGHIPRRPSGRHLSRGNGSEAGRRDHQEKTGIGARSRRVKAGPEKKEASPDLEAACEGRISHRSVCLQTSLPVQERLSVVRTRDAVRLLRRVRSRAFPPGRLPSVGTLGVMRRIRYPWSSGFPRVAEPPFLGWRRVRVDRRLSISRAEPSDRPEPVY